MKKIFLLFTLIGCFLNLTHAQPGRLDPSFGTNGIVKSDLGKDYTYSTSSVSKILSLADGSMFVIQGSLGKRHANGSVDSSFGHNGYVTDTGFFMYSAAIQSDGKIVVAGSGNINNNYPDIYQSDFEVARYNTNGSLDSSFSNDGKQTTNFGEPNAAISPDRAYAVSINSGGKIVLAGSSGASLALASYNPDGSLDNTFDNDGKLINDTIYAIALALQRDDKIVVAGNINADFAVLRYNTNGSLDSNFSDDGIQTTDFASAPDFAKAVAVQNDGRIIVAGSTVADISNNTQDFALVRYNNDGSLDMSFSGDGKQTTSVGYTYGINAVALQNDGKIVAVGDSLDRAFVVVRYNADGSPDQNFSDDGKQTTVFGISNYGNSAYTVDIQPAGKIVVGGQAYPFLAIARYNTNGSLDNTFDNDGKLTDGFHAGNTIFKSSAVQKDGKTVAVGRSWNGSNFDFVIARFNSDGSPDNTFSNGGVQISDFASANDYANAVAIQSDGKIVVAGSSVNANSISSFSIARYNSDGSLDKTFGSGGKQQTNFGDSTVSSVVNAIAIQADDKIVAVGNASFDFELVFAVTRYNTDGVLDNSFSDDGKQIINFGNEEGRSFATSVAIQSNGKIVVGGISGSYSAYSSVGRLNADGSLDNTFSDDGKTGYGYESFNDPQSLSVAVQKDGKILVGGYAYYRDNSNNFIGRYNADGRLDSSFSNDGKEETGFPENRGNISFDFANAGNPVIAIQKDGKIIVSGSALTRYNTNGSLDSAFGDWGIAASGLLINSITISDNKLYAAGSAQYPRNVGLVARFLLDSNTSQTPPAVSIVKPADSATYGAGAYIQINAAASDADGTISKVDFYSDTTLLHTETVAPYGYQWKHVPAGNYTITAKATDNSGLTTTSTPVHITVVENKAPIVSIKTPANNQTFAAPATVRVIAAANDVDGTISKVEFYSGSVLLHTETRRPYTYNWENLPAGTYMVNAVAIDNSGARSTSNLVTIQVMSNASVVSSKPYKETEKTALKDALSLKLSPNPATNILNLQTSGLQQNKPATLSIISVSGIVLKNMRISNSSTQLDVSSLQSGVYTIKIVSGSKVAYKQFVKL